MKKGDRISFSYLKEKKESGPGEFFVYFLEPVSGVVLDVRDFRERPIKRAWRNVKRSSVMITLLDDDGLIKNYFHGKMFSLSHDLLLEEKTEPVKKKNVIRKFLDKLKIGV